MKGSVSHTGRVVRVTPQFTTVAIEQHSACSSCHAAGLCGLADVAEKAIEVPTSPYSGIKTGDQVEVLLKASMGMKAVWLAYCIPLLLMLAVILSMLAAGATEVVSGISGIAAIGIYYFVLWLLRGKLRNEYVFTIKQL